MLLLKTNFQHLIRLEWKPLYVIEIAQNEWLSTFYDSFDVKVTLTLLLLF